MIKRLGFTCREWAIIALTVAVMALLVGGIWFKQVSDEIFNKTYLFGYCLEYDRAADCSQWRDTLYPAHKETVKECVARYDYFEYRYAFFGCLEDAGL